MPGSAMGIWIVRTRNYLVDPLLKDTDRQCGAWAKMFISSLQHQGISTGRWTILYPLVEGRYGWLFVKRWKFNEPGSSGDPAYPYLNVSLGWPERHDHYEWLSADVNDFVGFLGRATEILRHYSIIIKS